MVRSRILFIVLIGIVMKQKQEFEGKLTEVRQLLTVHFICFEKI